jgi:hypothetical protein
VAPCGNCAPVAPRNVLPPTARDNRLSPGCAWADEHHKGHGRIERRTLLAVAVDPQKVDWPHTRQVLLLRRRRQVGQQPATQEYYCGVSSASMSRASTADAGPSHLNWGVRRMLGCSALGF